MHASILKLKLIISHTLVYALALLILNYSADFKEPINYAPLKHKAAIMPEFNEIESIYELVTECWMDIENHVPEQDNDDNDTDGTTLSKNEGKILFVSITVPFTPAFSQLYNIAYLPYPCSIPASVCSDTTSPPPDFV